MAEIRQKLGFDAQEAINTLDKLTGALGRANDSLSKMKNTASGAKALAGVTDGTKKATKAANEFVVGWKTIIRVLQTQLIVRGLNTLITGLKEGVDNARELGLAIEEIRTIDSLDRAAEDIRKSVLDLSDAIGQAPVDLAEGLYQTLSNQVVEAGESFNFMAEAARLAKVTASETGDAVSAMSSIMNSYNLAASETEHVAGTLFATVEQGRLRLSEIGNVIGRVTPLTAQLGITWEETAASIATMTRQGVRADTAITQLRAVVTRLLKPTAEMSAIFRKWGVEDGRQAIQTFGGLSGVLKKLATETGNNSGEMAELLRNVRAIAGVFGIMSDEGSTLAEVLEHVEGATKKATEAWAQYSQSDAQRLTVEMQRFENLMTRVGAKSLPAITSMLGGLVNGLKGLGTGFLIIGGNWTESQKAALRYETSVKRGIKEGIALQQRLADAGRGQYDVLTEASRKHYAEANKLENQLATARDNAIKSATTAFETAADNLTDLYKRSLSEIEKFANDAADNAVKALERVDSIQRDMEDQRLQYRLKQAQGFYAKLAVLDAESQEASQKRAEAFAKITADPASKEDFTQSAERVLELAEERLALAEKENISGQEYLDIFLDVEKAQVRLQGGLLKFADASGNVASITEEINSEFSTMEARIKEIVERTKEIHADGIISPDEKVELASLGTEYDKLQAKFKEGAAILGGLGLDVDFNQVVDGLTDALNQAHKDWAEEVNRAKAAFAEAVIPIRVSLDPSGDLENFQKKIGQTQTPGESQAAFAGRGDEAAKKLLEKEEELTNRINVLRKEGRIPLLAMLETLKGISSTTGEVAGLAEQNLQGNKNVLDVIQSVFGALVQSKEETALMTVEAVALEEAYRNQLEVARQGGELNRTNLEAMRQQVLVLFQSKQITQEQARLYIQLHTQLVDRLKLEDQIAELKAQQAPEDEVQAAEALLAAKLEEAAATKLEAEQQEKIKKAEVARSETLTGTQKKSEATANATEKTANAAGDAATEAGNFSSNVSGSAQPLATAVSQATSLANEMERAARAAASVGDANVSSGSGATSYHGGPFYAAGGMFRGQDRQLTALARGETVVNRKQSRKFFSELNAMNQGSQPVYRDQGGPVTNVGDVNVTVQGGDSSQQTVREIGHSLRREVKRGNIKLR